VRFASLMRRALRPTGRVPLKGEHVGAAHEAAPSDFKRAQPAIADQLGDSLPRDVPKARSLRLADPFGEVNRSLVKLS
jgi:hypothetical protein